ncbi:M48 family metallopeptidase [Leptospira wolffii]|uniref:M48 family metallopeptidase n=1 Tax=Leptospira wolffii TaxID=409998 RepID=UPI00031AAFA9|nr:SprT family zinc-dependent metalloprotease [Leptospira wolffii]EPG66914.1 PF01863 family protein [Leptospira wolffii serovar Khorat str. Khorat-H2]
MDSSIKLGEIVIHVTRKDVKNVHLSVYPPNGSVRIAAPSRMTLDTIRLFALAKLSWIKKQQRKFLEQERETKREFLERESHYIWGKRKLLKIVENAESDLIENHPRQIVINTRPTTSDHKKEILLEAWYREELRRESLPLVAKWERLIGVSVKDIYIQRMKTKWGSCNHRKQSIRLNTELVKKPRECLEYILVHEMIHILEPSHNKHFRVLMDQHMPQWKHYRVLLNSLPVRHENWYY